MILIMQKADIQLVRGNVGNRPGAGIELLPKAQIDHCGGMFFSSALVIELYPQNIFVPLNFNSTPKQAKKEPTGASVTFSSFPLRICGFYFEYILPTTCTKVRKWSYIEQTYTALFNGIIIAQSPTHNPPLSPLNMYGY